MLYNFNRTYTLNIESVQETKDLKGLSIKEDIPFSLINPRLTEETVNGVKITDLHIEATINFNTKTTGKDSNQTTINIYNLNKDVRDRISKPNTRVVLSAGYNGNESTVFTGQVSSVHSEKNGTNIITMLTCKDGWTPLNSVRYSKSYPKETPYTTIFNDIIKAFNDNGIGTASGGIILDKAEPPFETPDKVNTIKGWSFSGFLRDALESVCNEFNLTYQIIHSRLYIYPKNYSEMFGVVELRNQDILSIKQRQEATDRTSSDVNPTGVEITTMLIPEIDPSDRVKIKNDPNLNLGSFDLSDYEGDYIIANMSHQLSYEGNNWYTVLSCDGIKEEVS